MKSILNPEFKYVRSEKTDLKATFARERKRLKELSDSLNKKVVAMGKRA